jgi:hypothetical protein
MTLQQFVHNNRGINKGADLPAPFLGALYHDIAERAVPVAVDVYNAAGVLARWAEIVRLSDERPLAPVLPPALLARDMFAAVWGSAVAALAVGAALARSAGIDGRSCAGRVVIEVSENEAARETALRGLHTCARVAALLGMDDVLDNLVVRSAAARTCVCARLTRRR